MLPRNPWVFAACTVFLAVVPFVQAADLVEIPRWVLFMVGVLNVGVAKLLELMQQEPDENGLSDEDVERIAQARERIRRAEIAKIKAAGQSGG